MTGIYIYITYLCNYVYISYEISIFKNKGNGRNAFDIKLLELKMRIRVSYLYTSIYTY